MEQVEPINEYKYLWEMVNEKLMLKGQIKKDVNIVAVYQAMLATIAGNVEKLMSTCNSTIITHADETRKLRKKLNSKFNQLTNFCTAS